MLFSNARMAAERLQPIRFGQMLPAAVRGGEETRLVRKWAHRRQPRSPGSGAAAGEDFLRRFIATAAHASAPAPGSSEEALEKLL